MNQPPVVQPIGSIRTEHNDPSTTPVQTALNPSGCGRVVLEPEFRAGLAELDTFDFAWLLSWLAVSTAEPQPATMRQVPFLITEDRREIGLFAMRGPRRPNPIGLHLVRVGELHDDGFDFTGVDMVDNTLLLDIKPWVAPIDLPHGNTLSEPVRNGWFDSVDLDRPHTPASLRDG